MAAYVICIGSKAYTYTTCESRLKVARKNTALATYGAVFVDAPPMVVFSMNREGKIVDATVAAMIDLCRFENGKLVAVPWSWILQWAHIATDDKGLLFLSRLTFGTDKKALKPAARKRKKVVPFDEITTFTCSGNRHASICATSPVLTRGMVDQAFYEETGVVRCLKCQHTMREWSGDGFVNLTTLRAVLNHMERDPAILHLIEMMQVLSSTSLDSIHFFRFGQLSLKKVPADFKLSVWGLFEDPSLVLARLLPVLGASWKLFQVKNCKELEMLVHAALHYRIFGHVELNSCLCRVIQEHTEKTPELSMKLASTLNDKVKAILGNPAIEIISVSVFAPHLVQTIFRDPERRVISYVHVYAIEGGQIDVAGVKSIFYGDFVCDFEKPALERQVSRDATLVVWPANTFSVSEIEYLCSLGQPVILAGTAYHVPERELHGLLFTALVEMAATHTKLKTLSPSDPVAILLNTFPSKDIPVKHVCFPTDRPFQLFCPSYEKNGIFYFDRVLLTGLLASSGYMFKNISILPGDLIATTLLATAVSGKHVRVSHRERTF
jgi:hypothetical protein